MHKLKLNIKYCDSVYDGTKTFEVRFNDRNYEVGDMIKFIPVNEAGANVGHPVSKEQYTITYILKDVGLQDGYVALDRKSVV